MFERKRKREKGEKGVYLKRLKRERRIGYGVAIDGEREEAVAGEESDSI